MFSLHKTYKIAYRAGYNKRAGRRHFINRIKEQAKNVQAGLQNFLKTVREYAPLLESSEYLQFTGKIKKGKSDRLC